MKKRWFNNTNKGSYELSSDNLTSKGSRDKQHKSTNDLTTIKVSPEHSRRLDSRRLDRSSSSQESSPAATSTSAASERLPATDKLPALERLQPRSSDPHGHVDTHGHSVSIPLKETAVGSPKRMHRRQKSSGNWKMLLSESETGATSSAPESLAGDTGIIDPVRKPVSTKESRPLSFFQHISQEEPGSMRVKEQKPKRAEVFPWSEVIGTPSPSPSAKSEPKFNMSDHSIGSETVENGVTAPDTVSKPVDAFGKQAHSDKESSVAIASVVLTDTVGVNMLEKNEGLTDCVPHNLSTNNGVANQVIRDECTRAKRSIHRSEKDYVQRSSDPSSMKKKRVMSESKRRSYPLGADSGSSDSIEPPLAEDVEVKCEILKISNFEADGEVTEDKTFVLIDPNVKTGSSKPRVCIKTFSESKDDDAISERYKLAEAAGETIIDASDDSATSTSTSLSDKSTNTLSNRYLKPSSPFMLDSGRKSSLKRSTLYRSSHELSSQPSVRSFDEQSISSEKESLFNSISTKSYSVNDLTLLDRPSGFCTLDMKKMLGSFRMLDNIISEHATQFSRE